MQPSFLRQAGEGGILVVALVRQVVVDLAGQDVDAAVDPVGQARPFYKPIDQAFLIGFDDTLLQVNLHCRDGGQFAVCAMKFYQRLQIDVADIITVSYEES